VIGQASSRARTDLANDSDVLRDGALKVTGRDCQRHSEVGGRLCEGEAADHVGVAVHGVQPQPRVLAQHRHDQAQSVAVDAIWHAQRRPLPLRDVGNHPLRKRPSLLLAQFMLSSMPESLRKVINLTS
jgi:hypothetical protein